MQGIRRMAAVGVISFGLLAGVGVYSHADAAASIQRQQEMQPELPAFYISGFYDPYGRYCTGLFSDSGQLLSFWGCHYTFASANKADAKRVSAEEFMQAATRMAQD